MYEFPVENGVPPLGLTTVAVPSLNPKHVTSVLTIGSVDNEDKGSKIIILSVKVHPRESLVLHKYIPGDNPVAVCVVCPPGLHK